MPWYRSLFRSLRDTVSPTPLPALQVTSKPVAVQDIWGIYGRQKKSFAWSLALQCAAVSVLFTTLSNPIVQDRVNQVATLVLPADLTQLPAPPKPRKMGGGGGDGDRSPLPASKGRLPKAALRQFVPPAAVVPNLTARLTMEPSIIAPPDVSLPDVNMANYGDPMGRLGPPSNGTGSGGGIGSGKGGGVGSGTGGGVGAGEGGGIGGGVYSVGGGVTAPIALYRPDPEYSEEARKAKLQGTVVLEVTVDESGHVRDPRVRQSLGLGLDEQAIKTVLTWKFKPAMKAGKPVAVLIRVDTLFRLL
jgi:periplasmic protein TonB